MCQKTIHKTAQNRNRPGGTADARAEIDQEAAQINGMPGDPINAPGCGLISGDCPNIENGGDGNDQRDGQNGESHVQPERSCFERQKNGIDKNNRHDDRMSRKGQDLLGFLERHELPQSFRPFFCFFVLKNIRHKHGQKK